MNTPLPTQVTERLIGQVDHSRIRTIDIARHDSGLVDRLLSIPDMTCVVADVLDELGVGNTLGTADLGPLAPGMRTCGPAVTLRYVGVHGEPAVHRAADARVLAGDRDLYAVASPGDVAVVDCGGVQSAAVIGELSALWALKAGVAGCVIDGAVRDATGIVGAGLPVWSRSRVPLAARHRVEAVAINDVVNLAGTPVRPGDYIVADDNGVCIVPNKIFVHIVERCLRGQEEERSLVAAIADAEDLPDLVHRLQSKTIAD